MTHGQITTQYLAYAVKEFTVAAIMNREGKLNSRNDGMKYEKANKDRLPKDENTGKKRRSELSKVRNNAMDKCSKSKLKGGKSVRKPKNVRCRLTYILEDEEKRMIESPRLDFMSARPLEERKNRISGTHKIARIAIVQIKRRTIVVRSKPRRLIK